MFIVAAELHIRRVMPSRIPRNADIVIEVGYLVRVYRATNRRYAGLYSVIRIDGRQIFVIFNDHEKKFSKHRVPHAAVYDNITNEENLVEDLHTNLA